MRPGWLDDGLPNTPGAVTVQWSQVGGPGTATFADENAVDTTAAFSEVGEYVLRLEANDGEFSVGDEVTIRGFTIQHQGATGMAGIYLSGAARWLPIGPE